jgi:hypothetical protein
LEERRELPVTGVNEAAEGEAAASCFSGAMGASMSSSIKGFLFFCRRLLMMAENKKTDDEE